ncbi:MAG: hypothetical protein ABSB19_13530 [Methylomonas sp.]
MFSEYEYEFENYSDPLLHASDEISWESRQFGEQSEDWEEALDDDEDWAIAGKSGKSGKLSGSGLDDNWETESFDAPANDW